MPKRKPTPKPVIDYDDLGGAWLAYHLHVLPSGAPEIQVKETRRAFYAGAEAMFNLVDKASAGDATEDEACAKLSGYLDEIVEFGKAIQQKRA